MKKLVLICGLLAGLISIAWFVMSETLPTGTLNINTRVWLGYASMILSFSMIFVGIRRYRDRYGNGYISFGKALQVGLGIALIGSTVYVAAWLVSYYFFFPDFAQKYAELIRRQMQADGASPASIRKEMADMAKFGALYQNPLYNILFTYAEILPVGIPMALFAALLLKRKAATTDQATLNSAQV